MAIKPDKIVTDLPRWQGLTAAASLVGALAASSCCILPLALFALGVGGAWIANLTRLAPYQPYFIAATTAFLGIGYWQVRRSSKLACAGGRACAHPLPNRAVKASLIAATMLAVAALGFNFLAPLFLHP